MSTNNRTKKIDNGGCSRFDNPLHAQFHKTQYDLVAGVEQAKLKMAPDLLAEWKKNIDLEVEINKEAEASVHTARLLEKDKQRDKLLTYIFNFVRVQRDSIDDATRDAAERLHIIFKPYYGMQNDAFESESVKINGLRVDAEKHTAEVNKLGLMPVLAELYVVNEAFEKLRVQRRLEVADTVLPSARETRPVTDAVFADACLYILSAHLHAASDDDRRLIETLITRMNQTSADFRTTNKEMQAQRKKASDEKKKQGGEKKPKDKKPDDKGGTKKPEREEDPGEDKA